MVPRGGIEPPTQGFDWIEWESLEEDLGMHVSQLSIYKDIVKEVLSGYE